MSHLNIVSLNCRGLGDKNKRLDFFTQFKKEKFHIICLQDIHVKHGLENTFRNEWGFDAVVAPYCSNARGVAVLFSDNFEFEIHRKIIDNLGNYIILDITINNDIRLTLTNIYGPNQDNPKFYKNIFSLIDEIGNDSYLICGDWNMILEDKKDTYNYKKMNNPNSRNYILKKKSEKNLVDIWRVLHENEKCYTWFKKNPVKMGRLDFFLATEDIFAICSDSCILPVYRSDHAPVVVKLCMSNEKHGRGYWKFNTSLLRNPEFVKMIKEEIANIKLTYACSPYSREFILNECANSDLELTISEQLFWETLLCQLRGKIIQFSSKLKKQTAKKEYELTAQISEITDKLNQNPENAEELLNKLDVLNNEIEEINKRKMDSLRIRSRAKWFEFGEKSSKYFCQLENRNFKSKCIKEIIKDDGSIVTGLNDILTEQVNFYQKLYDCDDEYSNVDIFNYVNPSKITKLGENEKQSIEGDISYDELLSCVKKTKNNKSPGVDGFPVEFIKFFWIDIGKFLLRAINDSYRKNNLSISQTLGVITCIPKPGSPRNLLKNWRPISLLNTSYKLMSSCLAERLKKVLNILIDKDQTGFLPGRLMSENTKLIYDIIHETKIQNIPAMIVQVDFQKAFDTISWKYIEKVLEFFNFGPSFRKWISLLQKNSKSCIIQNGHMSNYFLLKRGCRQGDPISPYIFVLCSEILALSIRENQKIKGIKLWDKIFKISQYADDTTLFLDGSENSLKNTLITLQWFYKLSGLKINFDKTKIIWIGSMRESDRRFCKENNLDWKKEFKALGIKFNNNLEDIENLNFTPKLTEIKNMLKLWRCRALTPIGKITVIKTLALSKLTHLFSSLPNPSQAFINDLEKCFQNFIWNDKKPKISKKKLIQNIQEGGLGMVDIQSFIYSLKLSWIRRYLFSDCSSWCIFPQNYGLDSVFLFGSDYGINTENKFWKDVFKSWCEYQKCLEPSNICDVISEPLWFNHNIKFEFIKQWFNKGLRTIRDLLDDDGKLLSLNALKNKYNISCTFLDYHRLHMLIPQKWKNIINQSELNVYLAIPNISFSILSIVRNPSSSLRKTFVKYSCKHYSDKIQEKWSRDLGISLFEDCFWENVYTLPKTLTIDTYLLYFQYKISRRILVTNYSLKLFKIQENDLCTFCGIFKETLVHLFIDCLHTRLFWQNISSKFNLNVLSGCDKIFGNPKLGISANYVLLISRFIIYQSRLKNVKPTLMSVRNCLIWNRYIEFEMCKENEMLQNCFLKKWSNILL